ncbi:RHS repeat-associated core domain-containing protein [Candidatus Micrarchaeota archaeon]|nr:RHS repeat-associated core domain-containing protein [Candidatus Micrarchaeota archaeon]
MQPKILGLVVFCLLALLVPLAYSASLFGKPVQENPDHFFQLKNDTNSSNDTWVNETNGTLNDTFVNDTLVNETGANQTLNASNVSESTPTPEPSPSPDPTMLVTDDGTCDRILPYEAAYIDHGGGGGIYPKHNQYYYAGSRLVARSDGRYGGEVSAVRFIHTDYLSSIRAQTDEAGLMRGYNDYYPFGDNLRSSGTTRLRFTGQELDSKSGLYYMGARFYDPKNGRFLSVDPLFDGTSTPYSYGNNNPLRYNDPTGMDGEEQVNLLQRSEPDLSLPPVTFNPALVDEGTRPWKSYGPGAVDRWFDRQGEMWSQPGKLHALGQRGLQTLYGIGYLASLGSSSLSGSMARLELTAAIVSDPSGFASDLGHGLAEPFVSTYRVCEGTACPDQMASAGFLVGEILLLKGVGKLAEVPMAVGQADRILTESSLIGARRQALQVMMGRPGRFMTNAALREGMIGYVEPVVARQVAGAELGVHGALIANEAFYGAAALAR